MAAKEHRTLRGALLAAMEWSRPHRSLYVVEGCEVRKMNRRRWAVKRPSANVWTYHPSFTEALEAVADWKGVR
jgi:hypothetical protein